MRIKPRLLGAIFFYFFTCQNVNAEVLYWPQICSGGELLIKNKSSENQSIWLQKFTDSHVIETELNLEPNNVSIFSLNSLEKNQRYSLLNLNTNSQIEAAYKCADALHKTSRRNGGTLTFKRILSDKNVLLIQNLFNAKNNFEIEYQDASYKKIKTEQISLIPYEKKSHSLIDFVQQWTYIKVTGTYKSSLFITKNNISVDAVKSTPQQSQVDLNAFYFIVGSRSTDDDNFTVKITDKTLVEQARELIRNPNKEKMLFAKIQLTHSGFNRNWHNNERSFWSWSTSEVTGFGELGSTACNGTPQGLEDRVENWVNDPGRICFWNYRVKKELSPMEVSAGLLSN